MLLRALFLIALIAVLAETMVYGAAALAHVALRQREISALRAAFSAAIASTQASAAHAVASGGNPALALPAPFATCYDSSSAGCAIAATATVSIPAPAASPATCPGTDCTIYLQGNTAVAESRVTYHVTASVLARNGDVVATRNSDVTFRTFAMPPYVSLAGSLDDTLDAIVDGSVGDDGGNANAAGTLISVEYVLSGAAASPQPGNVWHATQQHPATSAPAWDR